MYAKVGNPFYSVRFSLIFLAAASPTTAAISSNEACLRRLTLLKVFSRAVFLFRLSPDIVQGGRYLTLASLVPWKVMAETVTSFCDCFPTDGTRECFASHRWSAGGNPYSNSDVRLLAVFGRPVWDIQLKFVLYHFSHHFHLSLSTVTVMMRSGRGNLFYGTTVTAALPPLSLRHNHRVPSPS